MKTITVCPRCGSADVWRYAAVNVNTAEVVEYDTLTCEKCGYDDHTFNEVEVPDDFDVNNDKYEEKP